MRASAPRLLAMATESGAPEIEERDTAPITVARSAPDSIWLFLSVGVVLTIGIFLRLYARSELWADEALSVNIAQLPYSELRAALEQDGAPPLYYLLLKPWIGLFGASTFAVRSLSGVIGIVTLVPMWFAGRRLDNRRADAGLQLPHVRTVAWTSLLLLAASPFAIRYATEARMYCVVILLVTLGYLAVLRSLDQPSIGRLFTVAVLAALLVYTHYWSFFLVGIVALLLVVCAVRGDPIRRSAMWRTFIAMLLGIATFLIWLPTFLYQLEHTGTPWGDQIAPVASIAEAFKSFGGNTQAAGWALLLVAGLALFARAVDAMHFEVDLRTRPGVRVEVGIGIAVLVGGLVLSRIAGTTFEARYAAVIFPLFILAAAFGVTVFASRTVRYGAVVILLVLGFWGGTSNALRSRTQAFEIANVIGSDAHAGDVVVYCPDSIGIDIRRLLGSDIQQIGFPDLVPSRLIDWTDYSERVADRAPLDVARRLLSAAGPENDIWFVYTSGEGRISTKCNVIADYLAFFRPARVRVIEPNPYFFEHHGLYRYLPGEVEQSTP